MPVNGDIFATSCFECGKCCAQCAFLSGRGSPAEVFRSPDAPETAFSCMVCGLCTRVCPAGLDPASVFLAIRSGAAAPPSRLAGLLRHEAVGASFPLTLYALPNNCDTIFFPGCGLAGTRPETTMACYAALKKHIPKLGAVLDCCIRPSHDTGLKEVFGARFSTLSERFARRGIRRVLTACPGCRATLAMNPALEVETVYEFFAEHGGLSPALQAGEAAIHDPCVTRDLDDLHMAARLLLSGAGAEISELKNNRQKTLCCGKGGGVDNRDQADTVRRQAEGRKLFTYCAGCAEALDAEHLLDHILRPKGRGAFRVYGYPRAYAQRLLLKRRLSRLASH